MNNYRLTPLVNTREHKKRIIQQVEQRIHAPEKRQQRYWKPLIALTAMLIMIFIAAPVLQQSNPALDVSVEKVIIPEAEYPALVQSQYVEETKEFLFEQQNAIFVYDVERQQLKELVKSKDGIFFNMRLSKEWFLYEHLLDERRDIIAINRFTGEEQQLDIQSFAELHLYNHYVTYLDDETANYMRYDIVTGQKELLWQNDEWESLLSLQQQNQLVIYKQQRVNHQYQSTITVLNIETKDLLGQFETDFRSISNIQVHGQELFMQYIDKDHAKIGSYHLQTKKFTTFKLDEKIDDFVTNGQLFAIAIGHPGESTVKMYTRNGAELYETNALDEVKERTVRPKLFNDSFVINGETHNNPMYIINSN